MPRKMLCCSILSHELELLVNDRDIEIHYVDAAMHVDQNRLAKSITDTLGNIGEVNIPLIIGTQCHPELEKIVAELGGRVIQARSCIEMLLGDKMSCLDAEANTFYLTTGWLENWRKIFIEGLKWDRVDARQNFGYYDRILLLDTGINPISDEEILEFYDYTQVPVEIMPVDLNHLRQLLEKVLNTE